MTLSNENIFRVTGPLWGESIDRRWIPLIKASDAELWCFLWPAPQQTVGQIIETPVIWDVVALIMRSLQWWLRKMYSPGIQFGQTYTDWSFECTDRRFSCTERVANKMITKASIKRSRLMDIDIWVITFKVRAIHRIVMIRTTSVYNLPKYTQKGMCISYNAVWVRAWMSSYIP